MAAYAVDVSFADTIHVTFRPSRALRALSALAHVLALGVLLVWSLASPILVLPAVGVVLLAYSAERRLTQRDAGALCRLRWSADHRLYCEDIRGRAWEGHCVEARSWGAVWVRLRIRPANRRLTRSVVIPFDAVDADVHRRLRARCRVTPPHKQRP
ncbi:protein YgfX [Salinisphaera hydrothermalis]|uniref:protein YgfX n=1 Tax=Salinisphaera hydrothermalis TaxID=563188 RepID=UPI00333EEABB